MIAAPWARFSFWSVPMVQPGDDLIAQIRVHPGLAHDIDLPEGLNFLPLRA